MHMGSRLIPPKDGLTRDPIMLGELTKVYAIRAREYYEAVAQLGHLRDIGPDLVVLMQ
jgi:hypothetical protein